MATNEVGTDLELSSLFITQNVCFIFPQFLYQFFCGFSQQVHKPSAQRDETTHIVKRIMGKEVDDTNDVIVFISRCTTPPI